MGKNQFQLFTSDRCSASEEIISFLKNKNANLEIIDVMSKEGHFLAQKEGITQLPTVRVLDSKGKALDRLFLLKELQELSF